MADRIGRHIADFGVTDPDDVTSFLTGLGTKLTSEFMRLDVARDLPLYEERLTQVALTVVTTFRSTRLLASLRGARSLRRSGAGGGPLS